MAAQLNHRRKLRLSPNAGRVHIGSALLNMRATIEKPDVERLFAFAEAQQGYFTTAQAAEAGYARSTHSYHVAFGNWVREAFTRILPHCGSKTFRTSIRRGST
jgi:hypothetical protein